MEANVQTAIGKLRAVPHTDPDYPGLTIYWDERQIAVIEAASPVMRVLIWDSDAEDPTTVVPVFPGYGE